MRSLACVLDGTFDALLRAGLAEAFPCSRDVVSEPTRLGCAICQAIAVHGPPAAGHGLGDGCELPIDGPLELRHLAAEAFEQQAAPLLVEADEPGVGVALGELQRAQF